MNLALFDLDGTLLPTDSDHAFGEFMVEIGWVDGAAWRAATMPSTPSTRPARWISASTSSSPLRPGAAGRWQKPRRPARVSCAR